MSGRGTPSEIVADLWRFAGGDPAALDCLQLTGSDPVLPSSFRIGAAAQASIAAAALAAAELGHRAGAARQEVGVDMSHAAAEFRSEHYLAIDGKAESFSDPLFGTYRTGDGRYVRLHMNFCAPPRQCPPLSCVRADPRLGRTGAEQLGSGGV